MDLGKDEGEYSLAFGYACVFTAIIFFGSNFVPVKKFETGDGMFYQWVLCSAIFLVGVVVHAIQGFPAFQPWAMLGGALWATGNVLAVPVIKLVGLSLGLLIWGATNCVTGWLTGTFGLFGVKPDNIPRPWLNYLGLGLTLVSLSLYVLIRPASDDDEDENGLTRDGLPKESRQRLLSHIERRDYAGLSSSTPRILGAVTSIPLSRKDGSIKASASFGDLSSLDNKIVSNAAMMEDFVEPEVYLIDKLSPRAKRLIGILGAAISGVFYGTTFTPPTVVATSGKPCPTSGTVPNCADPNMLHYVFPHFTGIFLASTVYFLLYCAMMKNQPRIHPACILPAYVSGIMWAVAQSAWFIANQALGFALAFPLITSGPGFVAAMWGICLFSEIKGTHNFCVLAVAFSFTVASGISISLSKL